MIDIMNINNYIEDIFSNFFNYTSVLIKLNQFLKTQVEVKSIISSAAGAILAIFVVWLFRKIKNRMERIFRKVQALIGMNPFFSRLALHSYLANIYKTYGTVINIYIGTNEVEELDINKIFVPLTLRNSNKKDYYFQRDTKEILTDLKEKRLIILGDPGAGKTTLLQSLACEVYKNNWVELSGILPVFLSLRQYSNQKELTELDKWITKEIFPTFGLANHAHLFEKMLKRGNVLLLLDGLDEVQSKDQSTTLNSIIDFLEKKDSNKKCRIIITCREQNYNLLKDNKILTRNSFIEYNLSDLNEYEIELFVNNRNDDFINNNKNIDFYLREIRANPHIMNFHRNPLLLTISIGLYLRQLEEKIPRSLPDLYDKCIENLLRRRDYIKTINDNSLEANKKTYMKIDDTNIFNVEDKEYILRNHALKQVIYSTEENKDFEEFSISSLIEIANKSAGLSLRIDQKQTKDIINEIHQKSGLIKRINKHIYTFVHRTFHEYFAARQLEKEGGNGLKKILPNLYNPQWHQIIIFYISMHDNPYVHELISNLIHMLRSSKKHEILSIAELTAKCLSVLKPPYIDLRLKVLNNLEEAMASASSVLKSRLLVSLLIMGRNAPVEISQQVENIFKSNLDTESRYEIAREISRLNEEIAISLLTFMTDSNIESIKCAALDGLREIKSLSKITILWQLLEYFEYNKKTDLSSEARRQLFLLIENHDDAVDRLNKSIERLSNIPKDSIISAYPFLMPNKKANNFSKLIALEKINLIHIKNNDKFIIEKNSSSFKKFLYTSIRNKKLDEEKEWQRLPIDILKKRKSIQWQTIGWIWWALGLIINFYFFYLILDRVAIDHAPIKRFVFVIAILNGILISLGWQFFKYIAFKLNCIAEFGIANKVFKSLLKGKARKNKSLPFLHIGYNIIICFPMRVFIFSIYSGMIFFALWINHPNINGHCFGIRSLVFSPDGKQVLTGSNDTSAILWNANNGKLKHYFKKHKYPVFAVSFSSDGDRLISIDAKGIYNIWDTETSKIIENNYLIEDSEYLQAIDISSDWKTIVYGVKSSTDGYKSSLAEKPMSIFVHALSTNQILKVLKVKDSTRNVAISSDSNKVLIISEYGKATLWNINNNKIIDILKGKKKITNLNFECKEKNNSKSVLFFPKKQLIKSKNNSHIISENLPYNYKLHSILPDKYSDIKSPSNYKQLPEKKIYLNNKNKSLPKTTIASNSDTFTNTSNLQKTSLYRGDSEGYYPKPLNLTSPPEKVFLTSPPENVILPKENYSVTKPEIKSRKKNYQFWGPTFWGRAAFFKDGRSLVTTTPENHAILWNENNSTGVKKIHKNINPISSLAISNNEDIIAIGSVDGSIILCKTETGKLIQKFQKHKQAITTLAFSPDDKKIITGGDKSVAVMWDIETGATLWETSPHFLSIQTWNSYYIILYWCILILLFAYFPFTRLFDKGRLINISKTNRFIWIYDLDCIEKLLPKKHLNDLIAYRKASE